MLVKVEVAREVCARLPVAEGLARRLRRLARVMWTERWRKVKPTGKPRPPEMGKRQMVYPSGGHTSIYRLIHPDNPQNSG